uniref:T-complex-associated testis-expressed protein 1 n=1 Tax=Trichobilharzia regenti TaxID=157069 RepID=A0AA85JIE6_TRIRE|nr:unnamed protein product [Trichobilharzia regenti]
MAEFSTTQQSINGTPMVNDESKLTTLNDALNKTQSTIPLSTEISAHPTTIQMRERFEKRSSDCRIMRRIIAEDPNYNLTTVPSLVDLCLKHCSENFEFNPTPINYLNEKQKNRVLDALPTNLPLKVTSCIIHEDKYWKKCCHARWPTVDISHYGGSWKRAYFERLLEEIIENFIPGTTYAPRLHEYVAYAAPYVYSLCIKQLLPPLKQKNKAKNSDGDSGTESESDNITALQQTDHLDLTPVLKKLTNLQELSLTYLVKDCGMNFEWSLFQFTIHDCLNLSKAVQQHSNLKVLSLTNSHVNSEQCRTLATHLQHHPTVECLDLSHNFIGYRGTRALSKLVAGKSRINSLNLTNNRLKSNSGLALAYALARPECLLIKLNLRLNRIQDEGGVALAKALIHNSVLKELNLAVNGLQENTAGYFAHVLSHNSTLTHLDLSNNQIGVIGSRKLQDGMDRNLTLIHLDLRFTGSCQEAEYAISQRIEANQSKIRKLASEIPELDPYASGEVTSVARQQLHPSEYSNEAALRALKI